MDILDNFLDEKYFNDLKNQISAVNFPFYFVDGVTDIKNNNIDHFYFFHKIYDNGQPMSDFFPLFVPLLNKLKVKSIMRIKVNLYTKTHKLVRHNMHTDFDFDHKGALLSLNDCDGGTWINDKFIKSKANQIIFFNPAELHTSTSCTNAQARKNVILNYF
jgi:hypothetical protein